MKCLSCEIHVLYRIVLRFSKEAILTERPSVVLRKFLETHSAHIRTFGNVAVLLIDRQLPNQQKRTIMAFADGFKKEINSADLDEGFIEVFEPSDLVELLNVKEELKVCKPKKKD